MSNRLSKDELESDALVTSYVRATTFYRENKVTLYGGLIALIVVVGGIFWYITHSAAQESDILQHRNPKPAKALHLQSSSL